MKKTSKQDERQQYDGLTNILGSETPEKAAYLAQLNMARTNLPPDISLQQGVAQASDLMNQTYMDNAGLTVTKIDQATYLATGKDSWRDLVKKKAIKFWNILKVHNQ